MGHYPPSISKYHPLKLKDKLPQMKSELVKVETVGSIKKNKSSLDREQSLVSSWCG
jgi:hypothetical protein